jgi:hypothetical protein
MARLTRGLGADFLYLSATLEPAEYRGARAALERATSSFRRVYANETVSIWRLL